MDDTNVKKIKVTECWMNENLSPWNWSHDKYFNYFGIVTRNSNGEYKYDWLKASKNSDEYFNVSTINCGDVVLAGCKNRYKQRNCGRCIYVVLKKTENEIVFGKADNFNEAKELFKNTINK